MSALTFGDVMAILPSLGVRTMLEVIDVLDTIERLDGLFVDTQLMSDGSTVMSAPYSKEDDEFVLPEWNPHWDAFVGPYSNDIPF